MTTKLSFSQFIYFGFVAIINTGFSYGVYVFLIFLDFRYEVASLASIVLGIFFSFFTQGAIVFNGICGATFIRYIAVWCVLYLLNIWLIGQIQKLSLNLYLAGALATLPIGLIGYFFMKYYVFSLTKINK
jgi:putative flippase GtrA